MEVSQAITQKSASNLALAFILLPKQKRQGMAALYAFCREVDDIADDHSSPLDLRRRRLQEWRDDIRKACQHQTPSLPVNRELQPVIERHQLPFHLFDELIQGVEMDLDINRYPSFADLEQYCYRVASVVGLLSIEIFGYQDPACRDYAVYLGKALQLTNILRDVRGDAERGRIYLPLDQLQQFDVRPEEILQSTYSPRFFALAQSTAARARAFYSKARQTLPRRDARAMASAELMGSVYWRLLQELERRRFNVFDSPTARISKPEKLFLILRTWYRIWTGTVVPNYGAG